MTRLPYTLLRRAFTARSTLQQKSKVPTFVLYSGGSECSLCDEAIDLLDAMEGDFDLEIVNIRGQPDTPELRKLRRKYQYSIPVLTLEVSVVGDN